MAAGLSAGYRDKPCGDDDVLLLLVHRLKQLSLDSFTENPSEAVVPFIRSNYLSPLTSYSSTGNPSEEVVLFFLLLFICLKQLSPYPLLNLPRFVHGESV